MLLGRTRRRAGGAQGDTDQKCIDRSIYMCVLNINQI